jgi:hypothetical protein
VDPRAGLDEFRKSHPPPGFHFGTSNPWRVAILTKLSCPHRVGGHFNICMCYLLTGVKLSQINVPGNSAVLRYDHIMCGMILPYTVNF